MNTNLLVRKSVFLNPIIRANVQLSALLFLFFLSLGLQTYAVEVRNVVTIELIQPQPFCSPSNGDITTADIVSKCYGILAGTSDTIPLKYTYYYDNGGRTGAEIPLSTAKSLPTGMYWIVGTLYNGGVPTTTSGQDAVYVVVNPVNTVGVASSMPTLCINTFLTAITHVTTGATGISNDGVPGANGLPAGVSAHWAANTITISGTPTASGTFNYSILLTGGCGTVNATGTITVMANNTVTRTSVVSTDAQTVCINTPITNITYATTGATGANVTNLPAGVTGSWAGNVVTISGTPTVAGAALTYTVTLTGGCGAKSTTGTIAVTANNIVTRTSAVGTDAQTVCINTPITNITYATTGATGIGAATGLPAGVTVAWAANVITISGTPTARGTFNYSIPLTGGCGAVNATGTITVADNTIAMTSAVGTDAQTVCINTPITNITYATTGATGANVTNLPAGVTGSWAGNVVTISGTPTVAGAALTYTVTLTGGCGAKSATGTIAVTASNTVTRTSAVGTDAQTVCINTPITNITYATTGATGIGAATGLPAGVTVAWAANVITISGTPTASGTFNYSIPSTGGCVAVNATGTITVNAAPATPTIVTTQPTCSAFTITVTAPKEAGMTYSKDGLTYNTTGIFIVGEGIYNVTAKNLAGCISASTTVTVAELSLSLIGTNPTKSGASDGKIDAIITGGTAPYTNFWKRPALPDTTTVENRITKLKFGKYFLTVTDKNGCSKKDSIALSPEAVDDTASTPENKPVTFNVLTNDAAYGATIDPSKVDLNPLLAGVQTTYIVDKKGVFTVSITGDVTFRPLPNYYGVVVIQYVVSDNDGLLSNIANITVTVISSNLPPKAINDTIRIAEHIQAIGNVIANDSDPDNDILTLSSFQIGSTVYTQGTSATIPTVGTIVINLNGSFTFTPLGHFFGDVPPIDYTIADVEGLTASATLIIIVTPVNDPPIAINDNFEGKENTILEENVLVRNPSDPDSDPKNLVLTVDTIPVQSPAHGKVVISPNGDFTYQPLIDFIGTDSFIYRICNNLTPPLCSTATVTIVIAKDDSCKVFVPNVFTPNADGIHDYFKVRCLYNYDNPEMQIFNRNGNLIFKKDHYGNLDFWGVEELAFWNGRSQHKWNVGNDELPVGTYYYILKLGDGKVLTGFVFLGK